MSKIARIGFVGCPSRDGFDSLVERFGQLQWVDLDNLYPQAERWSAQVLPANVCAIIKRIVDNAMSLDLDAILFDVGYGKCDYARAAAQVLEKRLDIPLIRTRNDARRSRGTPLCDSGLPLIEKAERILEGLTDPGPPPDLKPVDPPVAIWGVPASDFNLYRLLPDGTRFIGWFRCLENRTPSDEALERQVDPGVPTIFFSQTFCHKNILAKELARKHQGLHVDLDGTLTNSVRAKIETFLRFYTNRK